MRGSGGEIRAEKRRRPHDGVRAGDRAEGSGDDHVVEDPGRAHARRARHDAIPSMAARLRAVGGWGGEGAEVLRVDWHRHGSFDRFPGYTIGGGGTGEFTDEWVLQKDPRLELLAPAWFEEGARVLDIGCGAGYTCISLATTPGLSLRTVVGLDIDARLVAKARKLWGAMHALLASRAAAAAAPSSLAVVDGSGGGASGGAGGGGVLQLPLSTRLKLGLPLLVASPDAAGGGAGDHAPLLALSPRVPEVSFLCADYIGPRHDTVTLEPASFHFIVWCVARACLVRTRSTATPPIPSSSPSLLCAAGT